MRLVGLVLLLGAASVGGLAEPSARGSVSGFRAAVPLTRGWSNREGLVLTPFREDVWVAERPFYPRIPGLRKVDVGGKMAVVRLPGEREEQRELWVHSPVELDEPLRDALAELGVVKHIVTPNTEVRCRGARMVRGMRVILCVCEVWGMGGIWSIGTCGGSRLISIYVFWCCCMMGCSIRSTQNSGSKPSRKRGATYARA